MELLISCLAVAMSMLSIFISVWLDNKSKSRDNYLEIDSQYSDLLKIGLEYPDFRDSQKIKEQFKKEDQEFIPRYNIYALLVWNLMETFYDLSDKRKGANKTWLPIIQEENKVHYDWFKRNQRLFKQEFQDYVHSINDLNIREGTLKDLPTVYSLIKKQFPANELKSFNKITELLGSGKYSLFIAENQLLVGEDNIIGYAFVYVVPEYKAIWLDYLAIEKAYQDNSYGTLLFNKIQSAILGGECDMFMEVEIPDNNMAANERNRRISFYEKNGARRLDIDYKLPADDGAIPFYLYCVLGRQRSSIKAEIIYNVINEVMTNIHSDVKLMPQIRDEILKDVKDITFSG